MLVFMIYQSITALYNAVAVELSHLFFRRKQPKEEYDAI